jgi:predicted PurR-regulated permease PerM
MLPLDKSVTARILSNTRNSIVANVDGILAVAAAEAFIFGIVFWIAGVSSPAMWGAVAGLASVVPVVGGMLVWLPIGVILAIRGTYAKALIVGLGCLAGQSAVAAFLRPRVVGSRMQQPGLVIALAVLGGTDAFGAVGILLGPVIVSVLAALAHEFRMQVRPSAD